MAYLDKSGLERLWAHIIAKLGTKVDKVDGKDLSTNDYTTDEKNKLSGIASGAEVNQNAFSNVVVGSTTIAADAKMDTLTFTAGSNVTITPDATNDKITIAATVPTKTSELTNDSGFKTTDNNTTYSISKSGSTITLTGSDGSTSIVSDSDTTYGEATTSTAGLLSASDKSKLDGITSSADSVSFEASATSGSKIGTITINGTGTDLYAPSHTQAASTITAGTFAGQVVANTSGQTPDTMLLRNSRLVATETTPTNNGEICWLYE